MRFLPLISLLETALASPLVGGVQSVLHDLGPAQDLDTARPPARKLHGRFLHITGQSRDGLVLSRLTAADLHPDPFYKLHSATDEEGACHRNHGSAGSYGAETTECDAPFSLINETFAWVADNLRDTIDFVIWTGDSARHDNDEEIPRSAQQVLSLNEYIAGKFAEVFDSGKDDDEDPTNDLVIPIVPTFGNNDILPHNVLQAGPNKWLRSYSSIWEKFIPEEQRHGFERGGWFYVEVIPNQLAVFSLNTLYFFQNNAAVDGCAARTEPGYEHMEWLRIQLQFIRQRGMKAILTGHVPPARTDSKQSWDESCWQKYTLWVQQYRDIIVGGIYGHMNIDHFMFQDTEDIDLLSIHGASSPSALVRSHLDDELTIESATSYLEELRKDWSTIPAPPNSLKKSDDWEREWEEILKKRKGKKKSEKEKFLRKIGGPWGERFQVTNVGPSVVPNYFPTLRVLEYNITGLDANNVWARSHDSPRHFKGQSLEDDLDASTRKKKKHKKKKHGKKPKEPDFIVPSPPSESAPPGPAYSPQPLTLLGYVQYFANLTYINNDFAHESYKNEINDERRRESKDDGKRPHEKKPQPKKFVYEFEYSTFNDSIYRMKDMTVRSYMKLAHRIGQYKEVGGNDIQLDIPSKVNDVASRCVSRKGGANIEEVDCDVADAENLNGDQNKDKGGKKKKKKKKKHHKQKQKNTAWLTFMKRAFVGTIEPEGLESLKSGKVPTGGSTRAAAEKMGDAEL